MKWYLLFAVLAVLSLLYGFAVLSVGSGTGFWLVWMALAGGLMLLAVFSYYHIWSSIPAAVRIALSAAAVLCLAVFVYTESLIISGAVSSARGDLDYIIVLGAQIYERGPSIALKYRLDAAYDYLTENENTICIVSGGQGYNEPFSEGEGMKAYLVERGIPEHRILAETESHNTKENIDNSMRLISKEDAGVGIVTNDFHIYRACRIAKAAGIADVSAIPAASNRFYLPNNLLREFFGVLKDFLMGNI